MKLGNLKKFWNEAPSGRFLNFQEILRLGVSSLGISFITNFISMYVTVSQVPLLYDMGTSGTLHATLMYLIASALGFVFTPLYGRMVQRTKTKIGRYKPYILLLAPVVVVLGLLAIWSPQTLSEKQRIIYVYMICTPTLFVQNLWYNSFNMFPGVFTPNQQERSDIWAVIGLVMGFAPTVLNAVKGLFVKWGGDIWAARIYGIFCSVVGIICIIALLGVKERVFITEEESKKEKVSTIEGLRMIVKNKPLMILTLALCLGCLKNTIDLSWETIARVKYADEVGKAAAIFGGLSLFVGFAATPNMVLLPWMTRKFNNRTILIFWQACNVIANLVLALIGLQHFPQGSWSPYVITVFRFICLFNALGSLQPLILSENAELQQAKSEYR
ncbi:MAG: MFS transporter, partial [Clostridia bacterium]|nr:MFS transporter [Clostridia bacterium]